MNIEMKTDAVPSTDSFGEGMCPVKWALDCVTIARNLDDGKNVMGRDGMTQLQVILTDWAAGIGESDDPDLVRDICGVIVTTPGCDIAKQAAQDVLWSLNTYSAEWLAHRRKRCTALICFDTPAFSAPAAGTGERRRRRRGAGAEESGSEE